MSKKLSKTNKNKSVPEKSSIVRFLTKPENNASKSEDSISNFVQNKLASQINQCVAVANEKEAEEINENETEKKEIEKELMTEREKNEKLTNDLKKSVALIKEIGNSNLKKDIEIEKLTRQISMTSINAKPATLFSEFSGFFHTEQLNKLRSITSGKAKDSSFVLACMRFLYPNKDDLLHISLTGKMAKNQMNKKKMCPENVKIVTKMLQQRLLSEESLDGLSISKRMKNVNKLIKDAIYRITLPKHRLEKTCAHVPISKHELVSSEVTQAKDADDECRLVSTKSPVQSPISGRQKYLSG